MENLIATGELDQIRPTATDVGKAYRIDDALGRYVEYAKQTFPKGMTLEGLRIAVECAHGAAYKAAPCILRELGADVHVINHEPDGVNINDHCGSTHPEEIRKAVIECHADVGIALDGDADRVIMTDENAREVDGDMMLAVIALDWQQHGLLRNNLVVSTTIGNLGVEHFLQNHDIRMVRADVGDRNVIYAMREHDAALGGEPCGHIVVQQVSTTGDGMMAALQVLAAMRHNDMSLSRLCKDIIMYPSLSANVPVAKKPPIETCATLQKALAAAQRQLGSRGRIVVRYSGTEPKLRVTVEGDDNREIQALLRQLCDAARADLGA
jgi:phosphoglucosamine mutase